MSTGSYDHNSGAFTHEVQKLCGEDEVSNVVDSELTLKSVIGLLPVKWDETCIIYEDIYSLIFLMYLLGEFLDWGYISKIAEYEFQVTFFYFIFLL